MTIKKVKTGYRLASKKGKNLGTYKSKAGAEKREKQVQYLQEQEGQVVRSRQVTSSSDTLRLSWHCLNRLHE